MIYVDDRELPEIIELGRKYLPDLQVKRLKIGDINYKEVCIERKHGTDLPASLMDKRLERQAKKMRDNFKFPFIFFINEGIEDNYRYRWFNESVLNGTQASMCIGHDVPLIPCKDNKEFWKKTRAFISKYDIYDGNTPIVENNSFKRDRTVSPEENMLRASIPGIGKAKAEAILNKYHIYQLYDVSKKDLTSIDGIGDKFADRLKSVFTKEKGMV